MSEPITVMHLRASNFVGGPEKQILEHLKRIDKQRFRPILCSFEKSDNTNDLLRAGELEGIRSLRLKSKSTFSPDLVLQLRELLIENSVQILVTHGYKPNILGCLLAKYLGIPMIVYSHGWTGENGTIRFYECLDRFFLKFARNIVAVSEGHKKQIVAHGIPNDRITVIHNAVFVPEPIEHINIRKRYSLPEDSTIVISAGRLSPEKNFAGLIDAAEPILKARNDLYFIVLGEGVLRQELEQKIFNSGIQGRFLLPGFTKDVQSLLTDADIFVSSSHTEGLPVAVLEGAGAGLPVVATSVGGTPEVIHDGYNGLLVPKNNVLALRSAIEHLLEHPEEAKNMGKHGAAVVRESFDFESHSRKLEELYFKVAYKC